jgi:hypothetical protein
MKPLRKKIKAPFHLTVNDNFCLFGIVSNEPDYKLSLFINKELQIALKNNTSVEVSDENSHITTYSRYSDNTKTPHINYTLVSNRSGTNYLVKKLKSYDYFFIVQDEEEECDPQTVARKLKESGLFTAIFNIDLKEVNDKNLRNLIP